MDQHGRVDERRIAFGDHGLTVSLDRYKSGLEEDLAVLALLEVVWWVDACAEIRWSQVALRPRILQAVRGARNAGSHQLAASARRMGVLTVPFTVPIKFQPGPLRWLPNVARMIKPDEQRAAYLDLLSNRPVDQTLDAILAALYGKDDVD